MFQATLQTSYHKLSNDEDTEIASNNLRLDKSPRLRNRLLLLAWLLNIFSWLAFLPLTFLSQNWGVPDDQRCSQQLSVWSPALQSIEIVDGKMENSFFHQSPFRGKPTAALEKAWDGLWNHGLVAFDDDKLPLLNKSQTRNWRRSKDGRVLASLEVFHDLHCLSFIRQYTYRDQYDYSSEASFDGTPEMVREHVDHCIESLRLKIQCTSDVTPYMELISPQSLKGGQLDFETQHRCRDFEKIRDWYLDNTLSWDEA